DLLGATWKTQPETGYDGAIQQTVDSVVLDHLMALAADDHAASQTRAIASLKLDELKTWLTAESATDESRRAQFFFAAQEIDRFEKNPETLHLTLPVPPPAGDPIGADGWQ